MPPRPPARRPGRATALGTLALSAALAASAVVGIERSGAASAAPATQPPPGFARPLALPAPGLPGLPDISPDLAAVSVDGPAFRAATSAYVVADGTHAGARDQRVELDRTVDHLGAEASRLSTAKAREEARAATAQRRHELLDSAISELLVEVYVSGGVSEQTDAAVLDEQPSVHPEARRRVLAGASLETLLAERDAAEALHREAADRARLLGDELAAVEQRRWELASARPEVQASEVGAGDDLAARRVDYEAARVLSNVHGGDFPLVALDAYHRAAARLRDERPECGIEWWALAGISRVEGRHGTFGGSSLDRYGNTTRRIIGIALDGENDTAAIPDSDGGALDGDPVHDRAVGPMQFIPSTWRRFAADGNGDGVADPHNLYDASLAAARYLCASSSGLGGDAGLRTGFLAYNRSLPYAERVLGFARGYQHSVTIPLIEEDGT